MLLADDCVFGLQPRTWGAMKNQPPHVHQEFRRQAIKVASRYWHTVPGLQTILPVTREDQSRGTETQNPNLGSSSVKTPNKEGKDQTNPGGLYGDKSSPETDAIEGPLLLSDRISSAFNAVSVPHSPAFGTLDSQQKSLQVILQS